VIRPAVADDVPAIASLVRALADYERAPEHAIASEEHFHRALFDSSSPRVFAHVAEHVDGQVVGFALWFFSFSTWLGVHGVYLEDLFVLPAFRGHGYGRALLTELAGICTDNGGGRLEWSVLDWNESAIGFYRALGASSQDEWTTFRITGDALSQLAGARR
jgi:GNAT superfamily N-acetyltransferase